MNFSRSKQIGGAVLGSFLLTLPCHGLVDQDGDGMSDVWEGKYGFSITVNSSPPANQAPDADADGDGYSNLEESQRGTDPYSGRSPDGILVPTVVKQPGFENLFTISWPSQKGLYYLLEATEELNPPNWFFVDWAYGEGQPIELGVEAAYESGGVPDKLFWRLRPLASWDYEGDGLDDYEEGILGTSIYEKDSDFDRMPDAWEYVFDLDPLNPLDADMDGDDDELSNLQEFVLSLNPIVNDSDNDGIPDGEEDADNDGLTNVAELTIHQTDPLYPDSDGDGLPDGWEVTWSFNPKSAAGAGEGNANADGDTLSNFDEYLNGTNPRATDTDGDGTNDSSEVASGGNPNNNNDQGQAPPAEVIVEVPFRVGDPSGSHSEKWKLTIKGLGPDDTRTFGLESPDYGVMAPATLFKLRKWNRYEVTMNHISTDPEYLDYYGVSDYDWEATIDGKPTSEAMPMEAGSGANNYFTVSQNHWLVENREGVLTKLRFGGTSDLASGKKAYLIPVKVKDNLEATGVDDLSVTVKPEDPGYKDKFWIMAPAGGPADSNHSLFNIPVNTPTPFKITCPNATPDPDTITIGPSLPLVAWTGTGSDLSDNNPTFKVGEAEEEVALQIGVKSMKKRTVRVLVHPIVSVIPGKPDASNPNPNPTKNPPDLMPTEAQIKEKLDRVFGWQINAYFDVNVLPEQEVSFDVAQAGMWPEVTNYEPDEEGEQELTLETADSALETFFPDHGGIEVEAIMAHRNPDYDINVFIIGGGSPFFNVAILDDTMTFGSVAVGFSKIGLATCFVDGDRILGGSQTSIAGVLHTIAHEIGHVMIGEDHPNEGGGPAPLTRLPIETQKRRLMASGDFGSNGELLIKGEWDVAESWLKSRPNGDN